MSKDLFKRIFLVALVVALVSACSGGNDTDGGKAGDQTFEGTQFVADDDSTGSLTLELVENEIPVSQIAGFFVRLKDSVGGPVPNTTISCDSEEGVSIIEPTSGREITDSSGTISGKIGCAAPGSYQFACRLPVGGNFRKFVTVKCTGDIPLGFTGFPGAAGGGLGGGQATSGDGGLGGTDTDGIRITSISAIDEPAGSETQQIDTTQDICTPATGTTPAVFEPFTDTTVKLKVVNNTNSIVRFSTLRYSLPGFTSSTLALIGETTVESGGGEGEVSLLAFSVTGPGGSDKYFVNYSSGNEPILETTGFRNIKFTLSGTTAQGQSVSVSSSIVLSFTNYNNCS